MSKSRSGAPRRVAAGLLAGALAVFGVALAPPAGAVDDVTTDRVAGTTRYGTAGAIAGQAEFDGATSAILATGENFPDALAASGLAGSNAPAPIILTESGTLTEDAQIAMGEIEALDDVLVVGGTAAISDEVVTAVEDLGYTVNRIAGADRYETAAAIAGEVATTGQIDGLDTAIIASGEVFADALAGGPIAYANSMPVLLVNTDGVPAATEAALEAAAIEQVVILGGTARITDETETELEGITGNDAVRVAGVDRFETAAEIGQFAEDELGWGPETVLLANGLNFPDALAGGPFGGELQAPIIMTASLPAPSKAYLDKVSDTVTQLLALGGTAAVSNEDLTEGETDTENTQNDADAAGSSQTEALVGPELQDVSIAAFDADDLIVVIEYDFGDDVEIDEDSIDEELFKLYDHDTRNPAVGGGVEDEEATAEDGSVFITFSLLDPAVPTATLAAVAAEAVEDTEGNPNPPQSIASGFDREGTGQTNGPDLISAEVGESDDDEDELDDFTVVYTFDAAVVEDASDSGFSPNVLIDQRFGIVLRDGSTIFAQADDDCETTPQDDEASETVECTFNEALFGGEDATDTDDIVRAITLEDAILLAGGLANDGSPQMSADVARNGNTTDGPNLNSISTDEDEDQVTFVFDEDIDSTLADPPPSDASDFVLYYSDCDPDNGGLGVLSTDCTVAGEEIVDIDDNEVVVDFPDDSVNEFLSGGYVLADAVTTGDGAASNAPDEVGVGSSFEVGDTAGPQLDSVTAEVDASGVTGYFQELTVTFTFDKDLDETFGGGDGVDGQPFAVWYDDEDGNTQRVDFDADACEADDNVVECTDDDPDSDTLNGVVASVDFAGVQSDDTYTLDDETDADDSQFSMPNPEGSFAITVPEFEVDPDA